MNNYPTLYRVHDEAGPQGLTVSFEKFFVVRDTPCYWYVLPESQRYLTTIKAYEGELKKAIKRVQKGAGEKKRCYEDKTQAMRSYLERKRWQGKHADFSAAKSVAGIAAAQRALASGDLDKPGDYVITEPNDYIQGFNWDC